MVGDVPVEPVTVGPVRPVRRPVLVQRWQDLTFVHWRVDPSAVAPLLPAGTRPDVFGAVTFVGLVAFRMAGVGLSDGPALPYLGTFCETNVRLYSVDRQGRRGVVFRSLDAARLVPVVTAMLGLRLPYRWARMRVRRDGDTVTYLSRRRWPGPAGTACRMTVQVGEPVPEPSALEHFLTARWGLHTRAYGRTLYVPNEHPPWSLRRAALSGLRDDLVRAAGLPAPTTPPVSVLYASGVPVRFGPATAVH